MRFKYATPIYNLKLIQINKILAFLCSEIIQNEYENNQLSQLVFHIAAKESMILVHKIHSQLLYFSSRTMGKKIFNLFESRDRTGQEFTRGSTNTWNEKPCPHLNKIRLVTNTIN